MAMNDPFRLAWWIVGVLISIQTCTQCFANAFFPVPENGLVSACTTVQCIMDFVADAERRNQVIVAIPTVSFQYDPYLSLYLGNIIDSLSYYSLSDRQLHYLLFEWTESNITEATLMLMSLLPEKSIFVSYEDGFSAFGIYNMAYTRMKMGLGTAVVFHLNHEQPWVTREFLTQKPTGPVVGLPAESVSLPVMESVFALSYYYKTQQTVLRNYYYSPIANDATYFPTGVPFYGYVFGNLSSTINEEIKKPASLRTHFCQFSGRVSYPLGIRHEQAMERTELLHLLGGAKDATGVNVDVADTLPRCTLDVVPDNVSTQDKETHDADGR